MADRDIEEAADAALRAQHATYCDCGGTDKQLTAGRGDATQPDPAVMRRAKAKAAWAYDEKFQVEDHEEALDAAVEAAAAVLVPATAEQIAAAIETERGHLHPSQYAAKDPIAFARWTYLGDAITIARSFAAGLSAGAKGGDGNE